MQRRPHRDVDGVVGGYGSRHSGGVSRRWGSHGGAAGCVQRWRRCQQLGGAGAFDTLAGKGISVAAPAGGAWSLYANWEADGSKQWETFLADELPNWLAANKGLARDGHGVVCAAQGGTAALTLAAFHSGRYRYAGSLSGSLTPSRTARSRGSRAVWRREHPGHVGCRPTGSMEMARSRSRSRRGAAGPADAVSWILAGLRAAVTS